MFGLVEYYKVPLSIVFTSLFPLLYEKADRWIETLQGYFGFRFQQIKADSISLRMLFLYRFSGVFGLKWSKTDFFFGSKSSPD